MCNINLNDLAQKIRDPQLDSDYNRDVMVYVRGGLGISKEWLIGLIVLLLVLMCMCNLCRWYYGCGCLKEEEVILKIEQKDKKARTFVVV